MVRKPSKEEWLKIFAKAVNIAIEDEDFLQEFIATLYPTALENEAEDIDRQFNEAFKDIFGIGRGESFK